MSRVIVSGAIANRCRSGGEAWVRLNWVLGLRRLGCEVYFIEEIERNNCLDSSGEVTEFENSLNRRYFDSVVRQSDLSESAALVYEGGESTSGLSYAELLDLAEVSDLLVNISGHLTLEPLMRRLRRKTYIDVDPGFTQFWHAAGNAGARLAGHDYYFTVGENIGTPACRVPTGGLQWRAIRPPIVLNEWPMVNERDGSRFTTVATWRSPYGPIQHEGKTLGLKLHEFRKFIGMPERSPHTFEIALDIHPADGRDLQALRSHGWQIADPRAVAGDPSAFRRYVQCSGAEFSVAQGVYVETRLGWFSDRTAAYLASGKPALLQDTGFSRNYPVGEGLIPFTTLEQALDGAGRIARDYEQHASAARSLAEEYFDSDRVLERFLAEVGLGA
jgi:hypothetical protein